MNIVPPNVSGFDDGKPDFCARCRNLLNDELGCDTCDETEADRRERELALLLDETLNERDT